jgi:hypothetical protein
MMMNKLLLTMVSVMFSMAAFADPAIVIKNGGLCGMPGSDADGNIVFGGIGAATTVVQNDNKVMLKCKGYPILNLSGVGQHFKEFGCGIELPAGGFVFTDDTHATVSEDEVGTMTCTLHFAD